MNNEQSPVVSPNQDVNPANVGMTPIRLAQEKSRIEAGLSSLPIIPKTEEVPVAEEDFSNPNLVTSLDIPTTTTPDTTTTTVKPTTTTTTTTPPTTTPPTTTTPPITTTTTKPPVTMPPTTIY